MDLSPSDQFTSRGVKLENLRGDIEFVEISLHYPARPKVELEQKAQTLHQDITKHWINTELVLLQRLIDRANEKGWRRELTDYLDRRQLLQTPSEQTRLLQESPKVIAEKVVPTLPKETTPDKQHLMILGTKSVSCKGSCSG